MLGTWNAIEGDFYRTSLPDHCLRCNSLWISGFAYPCSMTWQYRVGDKRLGLPGTWTMRPCTDPIVDPVPQRAVEAV